MVVASQAYDCHGDSRNLDLEGAHGTPRSLSVLTRFVRSRR